MLACAHDPHPCRAVELIHIDACCNIGGAFDLAKFHNGGPFPDAVPDGVPGPVRCTQSGIRRGSEYLREFSCDSGMTATRPRKIDALGIPAVIETARAVARDGPACLIFHSDSLDPVLAPAPARRKSLA